MSVEVALSLFAVWLGLFLSMCSAVLAFRTPRNAMVFVYSALFAFNVIILVRHIFISLVTFGVLS